MINSKFVLISRSDVLGQFMPLVGRDWTQSGVARLFGAIKVFYFCLSFRCRLIAYKLVSDFGKAYGVDLANLFLEYF